jgi:ethanolamine utilization protein EutN
MKQMRVALAMKLKDALSIIDDSDSGETEMIICKVIGHVWATKKEASLNGSKLMIVQRQNLNDSDNSFFVAADIVGAGIGETVIVVNGSTARLVTGRDNTAIDAAIVGIVDALEYE